MMRDKKPASIELVVTKVRLGQEPKASEYWRSQPYAVRIAALEELRREYHRWKFNAEPGFQRVYTIIKRA